MVMNFYQSYVYNLANYSGNHIDEIKVLTNIILVHQNDYLYRLNLSACNHNRIYITQVIISNKVYKEIMNNILLIKFLKVVVHNTDVETDNNSV